MPTMIEITEEQRAKLLELAASRGQKGFSSLVREAIDRYLAAEAADGRHPPVEAALGVLGTLDHETADRREENARRLRGSWR